MVGNVIRVTQPGRAPLVVVVEARLELGRECDGLLLSDERVSRRHAEITYDGSRLIASDLGSSNGTFLDGERITSAVALLGSSELVLGDTLITVHAVSPAPTPAAGVRETVSGVRSTRVVGDSSGGASVRPVKPQSANADLRQTSIESVAMDVTQNDQAAIRSSVSEDATVTIMFSDIESSTELALSMGDVEWMEVLGHHNSIFETAVENHGGRIIKNQGDGYMISFGSARRALLCAAEVQRQLEQRYREDPRTGMRVRIGCHTGEALHDSAGDLFGRHVIIAARVANLADGGQVLVSSVVRDITAPRGDLTFGEPRPVELKGVDGSHHVYDFDWMSEST